MDFSTIALILLQLTDTFARKYHRSSDESIENLLYFRDCQHKKTTTTTTTPPAPVPLRGNVQPDCPFPKMCCSLTCGGDDCNNSPLLNRPMESFQHIESMQRQAPQPQVMGPPKLQRRKKKKPQKMQLQPPIGSRRAFTKEKIMSLIHQDDDIRKILKDLVRVTMQKVDVVETINAKRVMSATTESSHSYLEDDDYEDDNELEIE